MAAHKTGRVPLFAQGLQTIAHNPCVALRAQGRQMVLETVLAIVFARLVILEKANIQ